MLDLVYFLTVQNGEFYKMSNLQSIQNLPVNPVSGTFGSGKILIFANSGTFTTPTGVTSVRARCFGGGQTANAGGGGGFAMKVINSPTATVAVTVGSSGGTSSFGAYVSATGGVAGSGGTGIGGDVPYNNTGGDGSTNGSGGVANIWGNGGSITATGASGAGGGPTYPGQSGFGGSGGSLNPATSSYQPATAGYLSSIDFIGTGGGGGQNAAAGGYGCNGGGGNNIGGGGYPGGGGTSPGSGARGMVIVEY